MIKEKDNAIYYEQLRIFEQNPKFKELAPEEIQLLFDVYYQILVKECTKSYTYKEIEAIKKVMIEDLTKQKKKILSEQKTGFAQSLAPIKKEEDYTIEIIDMKLEFIEKLKPSQIIEAILESLKIDEEILNLKEQEVEKLNKEKFSGLSYRGKKCVKDGIINDEVLNQIYAQIINGKLLPIIERVDNTVEKNEKFILLKNVKENAEVMIYEDMAELYKMKIKTTLENLIKNKNIKKYSKNKDITELNLEYIKFELEKKYKSKSKKNNSKKAEELGDLIETIKSIIKYQENLNEYLDICQNIENLDSQIIDFYNSTEVKKEIEEKKSSILENSSEKIEIKQVEISKWIKELTKEIDKIAQEENSKIREIALEKEIEKIKTFANKVGMELTTTLELLKDKKNIYTFLYAYVNQKSALETIKIRDNDIKTLEALGTKNISEIQSAPKRFFPSIPEDTQKPDTTGIVKRIEKRY